jgi:hypothetical protein
MKRAADYEAQAQQAAKLARSAKSKAEREAIEAIVAVWRSLAEQRKARPESKGHSESGQGSPD